MTNVCTPIPASLILSSTYVFNALEPIRVLASQEVEACLAQIDALLGEKPDSSLFEWSLQVSGRGIELMSRPLIECLQSDDWCSPGHLHEFNEADTLKWFRSIVEDNRFALEQMILAYVMRDAGVGHTTQSNGFEDALMKIPAAPPLSVDFDAALTKLDRRAGIVENQRS